MSDKTVHNMFLTKPNKAWLECSFCKHKTFVELPVYIPAKSIKVRDCWYCHQTIWRITVVDGVTDIEPGKDDYNASR